MSEAETHSTGQASNRDSIVELYRYQRGKLSGVCANALRPGQCVRLPTRSTARRPFSGQPMEQTSNEFQPSHAGAGSVDPASAMPQAATTGLAVIVDLAAQAVRFSVTMVLVLSLAGTLCVGLILSARQFSRTARASREAMQRPASIQSQSERLRSVARSSEAVQLREQVLREIEAASRPLDVQKLTAVHGQ